MEDLTGAPIEIGQWVATTDYNRSGTYIGIIVKVGAGSSKIINNYGWSSNKSNKYLVVIDRDLKDRYPNVWKKAKPLIEKELAKIKEGEENSAGKLNFTKS